MKKKINVLQTHVLLLQTVQWQQGAALNTRCVTPAAKLSERQLFKNKTDALVVRTAVIPRSHQKKQVACCTIIACQFESAAHKIESASTISCSCRVECL